MKLKDHEEFNGQKWICDLKRRIFIVLQNMLHKCIRSRYYLYLAPWNKRHIPQGFTSNNWFDYLKTKKVVMTQHHVDKDKLEQLKPQFDFMKEYGTKLHTICDKTKEQMERYFNDNITKCKLWINSLNFFKLNVNEVNKIKNNFGINNNHIVGVSKRYGRKIQVT